MTFGNTIFNSKYVCQIQVICLLVVPSNSQASVFEVVEAFCLGFVRLLKTALKFGKCSGNIKLP